MEVPGKVVEIVITRCSVVVPGTAMRSIAVVPFVTTTRRTSGGCSGVFALRLLRFLPRPSFPGEDSSLLFCPFALYSSLFFTFLVASGDSIYFGTRGCTPDKETGFFT